ncbi:TIR domain-containing protein [Streptomyces capillispiralis]|uniref:eIF2A-related protein n=1 Tax=Streptomyces capillispiralis TaxID=68182 RepID=UPI0036CD8CB3
MLDHRGIRHPDLGAVRVFLVRRPDSHVPKGCIASVTRDGDALTSIDVDTYENELRFATPASDAIHNTFVIDRQILQLVQTQLRRRCHLESHVALERPRIPADPMRKRHFPLPLRERAPAFARLRSRIARHRRIRTDLGYGAFLSYSGERDRRWLPHLQRAIEKQSRPWYRPPRIRVFLDASGVSIGPRLQGKIEAGLARSDWLVVMASPESKASVWVDREIEWWLKHRTVDTILLVVTAGQLVWDEQRGDWDRELSTALPTRLSGRFEHQPVWKSAALHRPEDGADLVPDVDNIALGIASVVRGVPEDDLKSEGVRDTRRNLRTARITAAVLSLLLLLLLITTTVSVIALLARAEAARQRDHAVAQQLISQSSFLATRDPFGARLKALAAWRIDPTPESYLAVLNAAADSESGLLAHTWPVRSVAFSPDGETIASGGDDGMVRLWDAATQRQIGAPFIGHNRGVTSVAFGPGGRTLVSSSFDGTVRLWNVAGHTQIGDVFQANAGVIDSVAYSPDGKTLVTGGSGDSGAVRLWDTATHRQIGAPLGDKTYNTEVAFSPDGRTVATGTDDTLQLWNTHSRTPTGKALTANGYGISSVSFSRDGRIIAAADGDGSVRLWNTTTRAPVGEPFTTSAGRVESVAFSPDATMFAAAYYDGSVRLWDIARHVPRGAPFTGHTSSVRAVAFSPDGSTLATASDDTTVRLWGVRTLRQTGTWDTGEQGAVALSPHGQTLAVAGDGAVRFWNVAARRRIGDPLDPNAMNTDAALSFSPDGTVLATSFHSVDHHVQLWDVTTHHRIGTSLAGPTRFLGALAFSPDGRTLAISEENSVRLWNLATHRQKGKALDVRTAVDVAFSPDGRVIATTTEDDTVAFWDAATQRRIGETPPSHTAQISAMAFSPDGTTVATASRDNTVRLWNTATRRQIGEPLTGHRGGVTSVAFSPHGKTLVTGSMDRTLRLWDVTSRQQIGDPLEGHGATVTGVGFGPGGKTLTSWSEDDTVRVWDVEPTVDPVRSLCEWARGAFTAEQWRAHVPSGPAFRQPCPKPGPQ